MRQRKKEGDIEREIKKDIDREKDRESMLSVEYRVGYTNLNK